jgi:hypothetical protein
LAFLALPLSPPAFFASFFAFATFLIFFSVLSCCSFAPNFPQISLGFFSVFTTNFHISGEKYVQKTSSPVPSDPACFGLEILSFPVSEMGEINMLFERSRNM